MTYTLLDNSNYQNNHINNVSCTLMTIRPNRQTTDNLISILLLSLQSFFLYFVTLFQLATDIDRRVREQAHVALEAVVKECGINVRFCFIVKHVQNY